MKKFKILFLATLLLFAVNSCNKDYPKDIPDWLKDKIKEIKKDNPCNELLISIQEYEKTSNNDIVYVFTKPCPMCTYKVYDYNGNVICNDISIWTGSDNCGNLSFSEYLFTRQIWQEKCKN